MNLCAGLLCLGLILGAAPVLRAAAPLPPLAVSPDARFTVTTLLARDDFRRGLGQWRAELQRGGHVVARDGALDIDVPAGCTVWFKTPFAGPLLITYDAEMIRAGGPHDRVSDLNCFWMARDARSPADLFATTRSGKFADYDRLRCYYVGLGGNTNTTTRFRRYIGEQGVRPLRPQDDLTAPEFLLAPNVTQHIALLAGGADIAYYRDGRRIFFYHDPAPYASGWFGLRTTQSHLVIRHFRVWRLQARE